MAIAVVANTIEAGATPLTTLTAINTTGATLLVVAVSAQVGSLATVVSDSKGNTWTEETTEQADADDRIALFYATNVTGKVGSSHTFTATTPGSGTNPVISVIAFSGTHTTAPFDQENGANASSGTSLPAGSVTPAEDNEVVVTAATAGGGGSPTWAIDNGGAGANYAITDSIGNAGGNYAHAMAYKVQTTATATNPGWSGWGSSASAAVVITLKAPSAGGATVRLLSLLGVGS